MEQGLSNVILDFVYVYDWVVCQTLNQPLIIVFLNELEALNRHFSRLLLTLSVCLEALLLFFVNGCLVDLDISGLSTHGVTVA